MSNQIKVSFDIVDGNEEQDFGIKESNEFNSDDEIKSYTDSKAQEHSDTSTVCNVSEWHNQRITSDTKYDPDCCKCDCACDCECGDCWEDDCQCMCHTGECDCDDWDDEDDEDSTNLGGTSIHSTQDRISLTKQGKLMTFSDTHPLFYEIHKLISEYHNNYHSFIQTYSKDLFEQISDFVLEYKNKNNITGEIKRIHHKNTQVYTYATNDEINDEVDYINQQFNNKLYINRSKEEVTVTTKTNENVIIKDELTDAIFDMLYKGKFESAYVLASFLYKANNHDVRNMYDELKNFVLFNHLPITRDGMLVAYKKVNYNFTAPYDSKTLYAPNTYVVEHNVDWNRLASCSRGLHVAGRQYVRHFSGQRYIAALINPEDVVAVPMSEYNKMRVAQLYVIGELPEEYISQEDILEPSDFLSNRIDDVIIKEYTIMEDENDSGTVSCYHINEPYNPNHNIKYYVQEYVKIMNNNLKNNNNKDIIIDVLLFLTAFQKNIDHDLIKKHLFFSNKQICFIMNFINTEEFFENNPYFNIIKKYLKFDNSVVGYKKIIIEVGYVDNNKVVFNKSPKIKVEE